MHHGVSWSELFIESHPLCSIDNIFYYCMSVGIRGAMPH